MRQKSPEQTKRQVGAAIKRCRIERGMSRRDLQEATGRSYPYLSEIEAGKKAPSTEVLGQIAAALGMEMHELIQAAERGWEPRGWVAPRESHFHRSMASPLPAAALELHESAANAEPEDPLEELVRTARELPPEDVALLAELARKMAD